MRANGASAWRLAAALLAAAGGARGQGLAGFIEEDVARARIDSTDQSGASQRLDTLLFTQRYRLNLDRPFYPGLRLMTGGALEQVLGYTEVGGLSGDADRRILNLFANLEMGTPGLGGILGYTRREFSFPGSPVRSIFDEPALSLAMRPAGLPQLTLRLSRPWTHDSSGTVQDLATVQGLLTAQYEPRPRLDLRYALDYSNPADRVHHTESRTVTQTAGINWSEILTPWRTAVTAGLNGIHRVTQATLSGGTLATQRFPLAGFSAIEVFPAVPTQVQMTLNQALVDGNFGGGAGVNLGFSAPLAGDNNYRDVGVQFADAITPVNTLFLWVDRPVPQELVAAFTFTAYKSDDNVHWTQVAVLGPAVFPLFQNRFEITIETTAALFLKVVARPLSPAATGDQRLADILVTEIQPYLVALVERDVGWQSSNSQLLTAALRTQLFDRDDLSYDAMLSVSRADDPGRTATTWLLANALGFSRRLGPMFLVAARVARQDRNQAQGHQGAWLYSASLAADELPTLGHTLAYSGQTNSTPDGTATTNSLSFFNRATPYRNVGLLAGASWTLATTPAGQTNRTTLITVSASLQPHPSLTLGGNYGRTGTQISGGEQAAISSRAERLEGSFSFNPFPTLYLSGSASRNLADGKSFTLANAAVGFSPFQGGALQLSFSFNQTLDAAGAATRLVSPGLRWNVNRSAVLTASYVWLDNEGGAGAIHTRTFQANLRISL